MMYFTKEISSSGSESKAQNDNIFSGKMRTNHNQSLAEDKTLFTYCNHIYV